ncbi:Stk1 family PASTA domain-containing Ser/Thr kinase [Bacillus sp. FJAT-45350]|uniref:Stk1 family PASTA domain-containing Ser/Thr kinase n=1 Tax=Bacillus sp. FJAT-45350 TaxID=2011014 RepID=UPI000BB8B5FB|nr:Stk1 family PASTA domain-containing Ser/Thr kinase [Bacillus sp. FJAT-45350]
MQNKRINGRYQILETIGGGGMANVYKARDVILDRDVAVKVLQPQFSGDEEFIKRFRREAQAASSLAHPNVVNIYDVGEEEDVYYIVMEYVEGVTLKELIQKNGALPLEDVVDIMSQVTSAISHAHANHIIHRDIKPHNILISHSGDAKVTDFGIARAISSATITHTNSVMGSVHYLSPEQARGGLVTYKSDIYSLGIVLYEMVTGKLPFDGDTAVSIAIKHLQDEIPIPKELNPSLPQSIENIILKSTVKDPFHRFETVQEMEQEITISLSPERKDVAKFQIPLDDVEATKAIPIIKEGMFPEDDLDKTIEVRAPDASTKIVNNDSHKNLKSKKKPRAKKWLTILLVLMFLTVGSAIAAFAILPNLLKVDDVEVVDVIGMEYEEAKDLLEDLGFTVEREDTFDEDMEENHVVRQNPVAGRVVKAHTTTVTLFVSVGRETEEMQNFVGLQKNDVERMLERFENYEFKPRETTERSPGTIVTQDPAANTPVIVEETTVILTYSVEPTVSLENLQGRKEQDVRDYFHNNGLIGIYSYQYSNTVEEGRVKSQSVTPFTRLKKGSEVKIEISKGPEPVPEPKVREGKVEVAINIPETDHGMSTRVRITYIDSTTDNEIVSVDKEISESETFQISLKVSEEKPATIFIYENGNIEDTRTIRYSDL